MGSVGGPVTVNRPPVCSKMTGSTRAATVRTTHVPPGLRRTR